jgi:O-antigen ligase/Tfp pilus assembly protein PilF
MWAFPRHRHDLKSLGLLFVCSLLLFSPLLEGGTTHLAAMIIRLLILTVFGIYWMSVIRTRRVVIPRLSVERPVLLFLGLSAASTLWSPYTNQSVQWMTVLLGYAGLLYLLAAFIEQWEDVATLRTVLVGLALAQAMWAFVQVFSGGTPRPIGTFFNPNFLAGYLATTSVLMVAYVCYGQWWRPRSWATWRAVINSTLPLVVLCILLVALFLTGSRGGALALVMGTALVIGLRFGRRGLIGVVFLVVLVSLFHNPMRDRVVAEHVYNPAAYMRWEMWQSAVNEMIEHPFGIGMGLYQYTYPRYAFPVEEEIVRYGKIAYTPHNEYLQIGIELGLAGLAIFLLGIVVVVRDALWLLRQRLTRRQRALAVGMCGAIVVILTQAAVDSNLHEPALAILLTLCGAVVILGRTLCRTNMPCASVAVQRPAVWAVTGVVVIMVLSAHVIRLGLAYHLYESGARLVKEQEIERAIGSFQRAIVLDPGKSLYHNSLAGAYFQLSRRSHDQAMAQASIEELRTAIALNPLDGRLHGLLGFVSASQASSRSGIELVDNDRLWLEKAVNAYEAAAELEPFAYSHRLELGRLMLRLGRQDTAEQYFKKVVELEPNFLPAREILVRMYAESERREAAQQEFQEIVTRQQKLHARPSNELEQRFLQVDVSHLEALLTRKTSST